MSSTTITTNPTSKNSTSYSNFVAGFPRSTNRWRRLTDAYRRTSDNDNEYETRSCPKTTLGFSEKIRILQPVSSLFSLSQFHRFP